MGTSAFSAEILEELANAAEVVCVYTQPDRVRGRGKKLAPTPVKEFAQQAGIPVRTPDSLKSADAVAHLESLAPDFICVAAYGMILPRAVLDIPAHGCINVHASLLPRWRGAAPIERAVLAGDEFAGVCIMRMEEGLDTGDFCVVRKLHISGMSAPEVERELAALGASALVVALNQIEQGGARWTSQDDAEVTYADKIEKGELDIDPESDVETNVRRVLASGVAHQSKALIGDKPCSIEAAVAASRRVSGGEVSTEGKRLLLGCADGAIEVTRLKPAGKNSMDARSFLAGAHLHDGSTWQKP